MPNRKIIIDATGLVNAPSGLGNYTYYLLQSLASNTTHHLTILHQKSLMHAHPLFKIGSARVTFVPVDAPVIGPRREITFYNMRGMINSHDLFHCLSSYLPAFGIRIPSLLTIHDIKYILFPSFFNNKLKTVYYSWIIRKGLSKASMIIAVSESTKNDIVKLGALPQKVRVVYEASTIVRSDKDTLPDMLQGKQYWLFVGENRPHKNLARVIAAYEQVQKILGLNCPLFVFAGSKYASLQKKHANFNFIFPGPVSEGTLESIFRHAQALVYPSLYEGFGLPILEAMTLGVPVITSNISSMPEVAGNAALLVDPYNTAEIAAAMLKLHEDSAEKTALKERGYKRVKVFSWDRSARQVCLLYEDLIK